MARPNWCALMLPLRAESFSEHSVHEFFQGVYDFYSTVEMFTYWGRDIYYNKIEPNLMQLAEMLDKGI
jgi:hypothetical protein